MAPEAVVDPELMEFVREAGLAAPGAPQTWTPLAGGVSSDVWRLETGGRSICVKRALERLKVTADWRAPVRRSIYEWRWMKFAQTCDANFAVRPLAVDEERGAFAMEFLPSSTHPVWKGMLLSGMVDPSLAQELGVRLARIHSASAQAQGLAEAFDTDDLFHALRLEPFFLATGDVHPGIRAHLAELASRTARTKLVLVHGDVSPKNILVGPRGPVLLDAECAWWGDPAFDAALFLTHLLLKCLAAPQSLSSLIQACADFADVYAAGVAWERREGCMARVTALIPALLLARVDGRSPVEYLPLDSQRLHVRSMALRLFEQPMPLPDVFLEWESRLKYSA